MAMALFDDRKNQAGLAIRIYFFHFRPLHSPFPPAVIYLISFFLIIFTHIFVHHVRCVCLSLQYIPGVRGGLEGCGSPSYGGWVVGQGKARSFLRCQYLCFVQSLWFS